MQPNRSARTTQILLGMQLFERFSIQSSCNREGRLKYVYIAVLACLLAGPILGQEGDAPPASELAEAFLAKKGADGKAGVGVDG